MFDLKLITLKQIGQYQPPGDRWNTQFDAYPFLYETLYLLERANGPNTTKSVFKTQGAGTVTEFPCPCLVGLQVIFR